MKIGVDKVLEYEAPLKNTTNPLRLYSLDILFRRAVNLPVR